jgi:hypothetical protein
MLQDNGLLPTTLEGWLNIVARVIATAVVVWGALMAFLHGRFRHQEAKWKHAMDDECRERKIADRHIEKRLAAVATEVHTHFGKFEILRDQMHEAEKQRIRELERLRQEMSTGFARLSGMLRSRGFQDGDDK